MLLSYKPSIVVCVYCEEVMDNVLVLTGQNPRPADGDISLCYECGNFMRAEIHLAKMSEEDLAEIPQEFHAVAKQIMKIKKLRGD